MAIYAQRVSELPRLLEALWYHPEGMTLTDLAAEVGRAPEQVRETLRAYYVADFAEYVPDLVSRPEVIEFFGGSEEADGIQRAPMVRLVANRPGRELGVAYASVAELARLYRAGRDRLVLEPDNEVLASAVEKLRAGLLPGFQTGGSSGWPPPTDFSAAVRDHRRVRIVYARAWRPGVVERVIEPYRLTRSRRGWEVDAAVADDHRQIRTFLLNGVQDHELLDEAFVPPVDVDALVRRQRRAPPVAPVLQPGGPR